MKSPLEFAVMRIAAAACCATLLLAPGSALARKKQAAAAKTQVASAQTQRAISELAGKFKWGMTPDEVTKIVSADIASRFDDKIKKEASAYKQDAIRQEMADLIRRFKDSYIEFKGQKTGWDVSIVDHEFAHKNNEAMMVLWEQDQRRFLFFHSGYLWKQFIAFNSENPAFAGKTFDDFADLMQKRYGAASMTFRKAKTSDDQQLDHLEWPPAGDYALWAIDLTGFYGNFCLSLWQKSKLADVIRAREDNSPARRSRTANVDDVLSGGSESKGADSNADIIDRITGHESPSDDGESARPARTSASASKGKSASPAKGHGAAPRDDDRNKQETAADPLEGSGL